ncbi:Thymidine kinase [Haploplasma axanthum]|uniref:Thymidine kinase n=2 Tax=Haploplasma axanthum TaxID=29552 RepID=A0A449BBB5_HAPAX|nr:Thymidine kinase [Haploplasma axanthum]
MYQICNHGYIEVVCGPMFAGKTEELIRRINRLEYAKQKYLIFKPAVDDRYSETAIVSHNKNQKQAINIKNSSEIFDYLENDVEVVVIDEAQFFDEGIVKIADKLADKGIRVIVGGLDRDFKGDPFGPMPQLLAIAEFVTKLTAICSVSGMPATRTQRLINGEPAKYDDPIVLIGATESYEPRSRNNHQVPGKEKW